MMSSPLLRALPRLLNACKIRAKPLRMSQRPSQPSSGDFSPASFLLLSHSSKRRKTHVYQTISYSHSYRTHSCLHAFTLPDPLPGMLFLFSPLHDPDHLWWASFKCQMPCEAKVNQSVFCATSRFVQTRNLIWNILVKTHSVGSTKMQRCKGKAAASDPQGKGQTGMPYTVILNILTMCNEGKKRNSWASMCVLGVGGDKGRLHLQLRLLVTFKGWVGVYLADEEGGR